MRVWRPRVETAGRPWYSEASEGALDKRTEIIVHRSDAVMLNHALELQHRFENSVSGEHRKERGQVFTPPEVARFMAGLFGTIPPAYILLDPGAGIGTLTAAFC